MQVVAKYIIGEKLEIELLNSSVVLIVNLEPSLFHRKFTITTIP